MLRRPPLLPESSSFRDMWRSGGGDCRTPLMDDPNCAGVYQCLLIVNSIFIIFNQAPCTCPAPVVFWLGIKNFILLTQGMATRNSTTFAAGQADAWSWVASSMAHFGSVNIITIPIIGQRKEFSGVPCLGLFVLSCLVHWNLLGNNFYQTFFVVQSVSLAICYHAIYASPWTFSFRFLRGRCPFVHVPIPHQGLHWHLQYMCQVPGRSNILANPCRLA